jgi:carbonic anhydrase
MAEGKLKIHGWIYDMEDGEIRILKSSKGTCVQDVS